MFYCDLEYYIDWSEGSVTELRSFTRGDVRRRKDPEFHGRPTQERERAAVIRNPSYYFSSGLHFNRLGESSPQFWESVEGVFGHEAPLVTLTVPYISAFKDWAYTHVFRAIAKGYYGTMANLQVDALKESPIPLVVPSLGAQLEEVIRLKKEHPEAVFYDNEQWVAMTISISAAMISSSHEDSKDAIQWVLRNASRPGVVE